MQNILCIICTIMAIIIAATSLINYVPCRFSRFSAFRFSLVFHYPRCDYLLSRSADAPSFPGFVYGVQNVPVIWFIVTDDGTVYKTGCARMLFTLCTGWFTTKYNCLWEIANREAKNFCNLTYESFEKYSILALIRSWIISNGICTDCFLVRNTSGYF